MCCICHRTFAHSTSSVSFYFKIPFKHIIKNQQWHCNCCYFIFFFHSFNCCLYNCQHITLTFVCFQLSICHCNKCLPLYTIQALSNKLTPLLFIHNDFLLVFCLRILRLCVLCLFLLLLLVHSRKLSQFCMQSFSMQHNKQQTPTGCHEQFNGEVKCAMHTSNKQSI